MNTPIRTTMLLKQQNKELIISAFREIGQGTRNEIAQLTGLSIATCGNIIRELIESGEVTQGDMAPSQGGRPSKVYIYNANASLALAISLVANGDYNQIELSTVNLTGNVLVRESYIQTPGQLTFEYLNSLIAKQFNAMPNIHAIGVGIPGMVNRGEVLYCDIEELEGLNLKKLLEDEYHIHALIDNEMHFKTTGYFQSHPEMDLRNCALLNVPERHTYGAGFIVNGQLIRGNGNFSGEVNYLPYVSSRKNLVMLCADDDTMVELVSKVVITIITITDPRHIIFCGFRPTEELVARIYDNICHTLPRQLLPQFHLQQDISDEYLTGIICALISLLTTGEPYPQYNETPPPEKIRSPKMTTD